MTTALKLVALTALMLAAVAACGKKAESREQPNISRLTSLTATTSGTMGAAKASCSMASELGTCNEYRSGTTFSLEKSLCESYKGSFARSGCSMEGQIASCAMTDGEIKRYYGPKVAGAHALSLEEAKGDCEGDIVKGTFTKL
jgi:hypothetical protein